MYPTQIQEKKKLFLSFLFVFLKNVNFHEILILLKKYQIKKYPLLILSYDDAQKSN